jgi:hypothetical protein
MDGQKISVRSALEHAVNRAVRRRRIRRIAFAFVPTGVLLAAGVVGALRLGLTG